MIYIPVFDADHYFQEQPVLIDSEKNGGGKCDLSFHSYFLARKLVSITRKFPF